MSSQPPIAPKYSGTSVMELARSYLLSSGSCTYVDVNGRIEPAPAPARPKSRQTPSFSSLSTTSAPTPASSTVDRFSNVPHSPPAAAQKQYLQPPPLRLSNRQLEFMSATAALTPAITVDEDYIPTAPPSLSFSDVSSSSEMLASPLLSPGDLPTPPSSCSFFPTLQSYQSPFQRLQTQQKEKRQLEEEKQREWDAVISIVSPSEPLHPHTQTPPTPLPQPLRHSFAFSPVEMEEYVNHPSPSFEEEGDFWATMSAMSDAIDDEVSLSMVLTGEKRLFDVKEEAEETSKRTKVEVVSNPAKSRSKLSKKQLSPRMASGGSKKRTSSQK